MRTAYMMDAKEVAEGLGVSEAKAYRIIKDLNVELKEKGFITVAGKIPRAFWETKFFGMEQLKKENE